MRSSVAESVQASASEVHLTRPAVWEVSVNDDDRPLTEYGMPNQATVFVSLETCFGYALLFPYLELDVCGLDTPRVKTCWILSLLACFGPSDSSFSPRNVRSNGLFCLLPQTLHPPGEGSHPPVLKPFGLVLRLLSGNHPSS